MLLFSYLSPFRPRHRRNFGSSASAEKCILDLTSIWCQSLILLKAHSSEGWVVNKVSYEGVVGDWYPFHKPRTNIAPRFISQKSKVSEN